MRPLNRVNRNSDSKGKRLNARAAHKARGSTYHSKHWHTLWRHYRRRSGRGIHLSHALPASWVHWEKLDASHAAAHACGIRRPCAVVDWRIVRPRRSW
eukprot:scaffold33395_cov62-Phaeocystis_antarctica.AAC.9